MAFANAAYVFAATGIAGAKSASTSVTANVATSQPAGRLIVVTTAADNNVSAVGDSTEFTVTDSQGNVYKRAVEQSQGGSSASSVTVGIFYAELVNALTAGVDSITVSFSSRTAKVVGAYAYTYDTTKSIAVHSVTGLGGTVPAASSCSAAIGDEYCAVFAYAIETPTATGTISQVAGSASNIANMDGATGGGGAASNIRLMAITAPRIAAASSIGPTLSGAPSGDYRMVGVLLKETVESRDIDSNEPIPISGSATLDHPVSATSSQALPFGASTFVGIEQRVSSSGLLSLLGSTDIVTATELFVSSSKPLPFSGVSALTNLQQISSSKPILFVGATVLSNMAQLESVKALPFGAQTTLGVAVSVDSNKPLQLIGATTLQTLLQVVSSKSLPFGAVTDLGSAFIVSSDKTIPFFGSATLQSLQRLSSVKSIPFVGSTAISATVQLQSNKALPFLGQSALSALVQLSSAGQISFVALTEIAVAANVDIVGSLSMDALTELSAGALSELTLASNAVLPISGSILLLHYIAPTEHGRHFFSADAYPARERHAPKRLVGPFENFAIRPKYDYIGHFVDGSHDIGKRED